MPFKVTYDGNGSDGGSVPVDSNAYAAGDTVNDGVNDTTKAPYELTDANGNPLGIVTGNLTKTGATFAYWNTKADGTGIFHGWPADTSFQMAAGSLTLYAQWFVTTDLINNGKTTHYSFSYDSSLRASGLEPGRTQALMNAAEGDYAIMADWFTGVTLGSSPTNIYVTRLNGGANNTGDIRLRPNGTSPEELRCYLVSEFTESFMFGQAKGWGYIAGSSSEESCGEALSLFLTQQFALSQGFANPYTAFTTNTANNWLNSSLPTSNSASTRFYTDSATPASYDFGSRSDDVNQVLPFHGNGPGTGCSILFIYYLYHQLGFRIKDIIASAPGLTNGLLNATGTLRGVYQNLTGDNSNPFPFFKQMLDTAFPPDRVSSVPGLNPDDPWPLCVFQFWGVKNTYGSDEVNDILKTGGVYPNGFSLALEGFNAQVLGSARPITPTIAFGGVTTAPAATPQVTYQFPNNPKIPQRILFNYDVHFAAPPALGPFPAMGETPVAGAASIPVLGQNFPALTEFFFLAGADPYFTNVQPNPLDPSTVNVPWLSQDLRVFTATPAQPGNNVPVPSPQYVAPASYPVPTGAPSFNENNPYGTYDIPGAYDYIKRLIAYLNGAYGDPSKADPFDINNSILPGQLTAYTGDSSVAPGTNANNTTYNNYNFAIARVRLRGTAGPSGAAPGVKVFFRLWQTQTADTDWNPGYTYLSDDVTGNNPQYPKAPPDNHTIPFFATSNYPVLNDAPNNQPVTIQQGDSQWAYFGCFLNLYDPTFAVNNQNVQALFAQGTHHCLVAEIAYTPSPIRNVNNVVETTENSDLLAQRNLQVSTSANPGNPATHQIPQTFDLRPTAPGTGGGGIASHPDELMIDWGNMPVGCLASIYWPGANAADVVTTASRLYGSQVLSAADNHTIQCKTSRGVTYIPIPIGTGESLASLLTIDLPATVIKGQEFNIVLRRIGTRQIRIVAPPPVPKLQIAASTKRAAAKMGKNPAAVLEIATPAAVATVNEDVHTERYVVGSFQVKIPVKTKEAMLPAEETTLAIFKARLAAMSPANRWYPVLLRYIGFLSARVDGLGGDANSIPPSFLGAPIKRVKPGEGAGRCDTSVEHTGKIAGLIFDRFGDFEGFLLDTEDGERKFFSREIEIEELAERAWRERLRISVCAERDEPHRVQSLIVREPPAPFRHQTSQ